MIRASKGGDSGQPTKFPYRGGTTHTIFDPPEIGKWGVHASFYCSPVCKHVRWAIDQILPANRVQAAHDKAFSQTSVSPMMKSKAATTAPRARCEFSLVQRSR